MKPLPKLQIIFNRVRKFKPAGHTGHGCNLGIWEVEAGESGEASQGYNETLAQRGWVWGWGDGHTTTSKQ